MDRIRTGKLGDSEGGKAGEETSATLVVRRDFELEEIVSRGAASPAGFWYDQERDEWVLLAKGEATLRFEDERLIDLKAGDHVMIPARTRHRVESTSADAVWVALHFRA
jgi:cupin 2 domain-containing protein